MRALALTLALGALGACGSPFVVEGTDEEPRLVVASLFQADSLLSLTVGQSGPALDGPPAGDVTTAAVEIFEDGAPVGAAVYARNRLRYLSDVRVRAGRTYRVRVSAPGFPTAHAQDAVPLPPSVAVVGVERGPAPAPGSQRVDAVTVRVSDPPGPDAYALYGLTERAFPGRPDATQLFPLAFESADPVLADGFLAGFLLEGDAVRYVRAFFRSAAFDGQAVDVRLSIRRLADEPGQASVITDRLRLARLSETYYAYARAVEAGRRATPVPGDEAALPSNVEGGYGIFAAFAATEVVVPE